uniref:Uncharacterized protein n=1 Tax=viral metagenome TaxID=1070528 RepID=A0A6M3IH40_9ZZZZ
MSAYNPADPDYNPNALGNKPFTIANPYGGQQGYNMSPVGGAIGGYAGGGGSYSPYGQGGYYSYAQPPAYSTGTAGYGQGFPSGMDPRYFSSIYAPSYLSGQQATQKQEDIGSAIERLKSTLVDMGIPTSSTEVAKAVEQQQALESAPIMQNLGEIEREIGEDVARRGASLGSERQRQLSEVRGAAAGALRQRQVGAPLEYSIRMLQAIPAWLKSLGA